MSACRFVFASFMFLQTYTGDLFCLNQISKPMLKTAKHKIAEIYSFKLQTNEKAIFNAINDQVRHSKNVIFRREKGKRANLNTGVSRKQSTPKSPKNKHFLPVDNEEVRNVCFSEILACFAFLKHPL